MFFFFFKNVYFLEASLFVGRIFPLFLQGSGFLLPLILYVRDSSVYLETSLLPFLIREKGNDPDIYKDSRYLLTGLNPTLALIPS